MPQPTFQDVHVSAALTDVSVAFFQDNDSYIADQVFPMVPVQHQTDQYFVWNKDDFFRDEAQVRADATESAGIGFNLTTQSYNALVYAVHKDIGPQVRANADPAVDIDVTTTKVLMQKMMIKRDRIFATQFLTTSLWSQDVTGTANGVPGSTTPAPWSDDANSDPFTDIETWQTSILQNTGYLPNRLVLSWKAYQALRKHPLVIDRIKYTSQPDAKSITPAMLAAMFDVDKCVVAKAVYNSSQEGATTASYSFIVSNSALLCYTSDAPGLNEASAGYTFGWQGFTGLNNLGIRTSQIPMNWLGVGTVRDETEMAFDMQVVAKSLGVYFTSIT
jgi:hypothetical protein